MKITLAARIWALMTPGIVLLSLSAVTAFAQSPAFTYQGTLNRGSAPANGVYDLTFALFATNVTGNPVAGPVTNPAVLVSNGLFTTTVNLGSAFPGADRWLELAVRTNGTGAFIPLTPRQFITATPYSAFAATAGNAATATAADSASSVAAANLTGTLTPAQLPATVVTNGAGGVQLSGVFSGGFGGLTNLNLSQASFANVNRIRFNDAVGAEQILLHAASNLDFETANDSSFSVGHDFTAVVDHDFSLHLKHDSSNTTDNSRTDTVGLNYNLTVGNSLITAVGGSLSTSVGGLWTVTANDVSIQAGHNTDLATVGSRTDTVGVNLSQTVGSSMALSVGNNLNLTVGNTLDISTGKAVGLFATSGVGVGTATPQSALHVYGPDNPVVVRVQSTGAPGFGRLEFVSNPQGDVNEWRPGYIQSTDAGGFTGGLAFYVNGTGAANKFGVTEVMRLQNGLVGIGTTAPTALLQVGAATCNGTTWVNASDRNAKEHFQPVDAAAVLARVAALPLSAWNYKTDPETRHIGPMAQDFYAAFNIGPDDKHISTVDADGVALAAIQGLNQKLEEQRAENAALKQQLITLQQQVQALATRDTVR